MDKKNNFLCLLSSKIIGTMWWLWPLHGYIKYTTPSPGTYVYMQLITLIYLNEMYCRLDYIFYQHAALPVVCFVEYWLMVATALFNVFMIILSHCQHCLRLGTH